MVIYLRVFHKQDNRFVADLMFPFSSHLWQITMIKNISGGFYLRKYGSRFASEIFVCQLLIFVACIMLLSWVKIKIRKCNKQYKCVV